MDVFTKKRESVKDIGEIITELLNEVNNLSSCKRAIMCTTYTGKILSKSAINKLINKYSTFIYESQNKGMEEMEID